MIRDFLESFKYSGFMFPVGLLRIYIGYNFFTQALSKMQSDYFVHPLIAAKITEWLPYSQAPDWYKSWLEVDIIPNENWKTLAYAITFIETTIGVSFLIGFFIRPIALLGSFVDGSLYLGSRFRVGSLLSDANCFIFCFIFTWCWALYGGRLLFL